MAPASAPDPPDSTALARPAGFLADGLIDTLGALIGAPGHLSSTWRVLSAIGRLSALSVLVISAGLGTGCRTADDAPLMMAAASTVDALDAALGDYRSRTGEEVRTSYGPTSTLARQIEAGAPTDLFLAASEDWARRVVDAGRVQDQRILVLNRLVVVEPVDDAPSDPTDPTATVPDEGEAASQEREASSRARRVLLAWARDPSRRIATADPAAVPAGIYAREALESLELWTTLEPRLIPTVDVRAALALAARGEVDGALVYATDARSSARVRVVATIDPSLHGRVAYPLLLLEPARPSAERLWQWLLSEEGRRHFRERGFLVPDDEARR